MADKRKKNLPLFGDRDESFDDVHEFLTFRPKINYVEPEQLEPEPPVIKEEDTIDDIQTRTENLINNLESTSKLLDSLQARIDNRVKQAGNISIKLDPVVDVLTIAALKRRFPDKEDYSEITYDDYKKAITCLSQSGQNSTNGADTLDQVDNRKIKPGDLNTFLKGISKEDIQKAIADPYKTDFGGINNQHGENRNELSGAASSIVEPIDLDQFQKSGILSIFGMMQPLITKLCLKLIKSPF